MAIVIDKAFIVKTLVEVLKDVLQDALNEFEENGELERLVNGV